MLRLVRRICVLAVVGLATTLLAQDIPPDYRIEERILVERVILDVYVTSLDGTPVEGLTAADFDVRMAGRPAEVEAVDWIRYRTASTESFDEELLELSLEELARRDPPQGRLIVIFVQTDVNRHHTRTRGQMKMTRYAEDMIEAFSPWDRVAVVSFDSHLKVRSDFTNDALTVKRAMSDALRTGTPPIPERGREVSLLDYLDVREARDAATAERGLLLIARALEKIEGPKSLLLFGYALGTLTSGGVHMRRDYTLARQALERARTAVFSIDISHADYHSLEVGLMKAAEDTGGFYAKTQYFPTLALNKLQRTLSARYELVVKRPPGLRRGVHEVEVNVPGRRDLRILSANSFWDMPPEDDLFSDPG